MGGRYPIVRTAYYPTSLGSCKSLADLARVVSGGNGKLVGADFGWRTHLLILTQQSIVTKSLWNVYVTKRRALG